MGGPEVAVIVTTYQMPWHLQRALESIAAQQTARRLEVVVCDDGSTDETPQVVAEFARRAAFPVRFVSHPHAGFHAARCRNDGVRNSTAPHLLFVDGDCLLPSDHIEQHLAAWKSGAVNCSYCVRFGPGLSQHVTVDIAREGQFTAWASAYERRKLRRMHLKSLLYRLIGHPTKPAFRSGNFLIAKGDLLRVNGFDEQFRGWGCEDDDLGQRFRAAGIQLRSVLNRTCVYHLWHPPAPSRPQQWKQGGNVAYLQRPIRLTRCLHGCQRRGPDELIARVAGRCDDQPALRRLVARHGWTLTGDSRQHADIEIRLWPGGGRFSSRCDCRVLAVLGGSTRRQIRARGAHVVLSPSGQVGGPDQVRLRLDDAAGLWSAIRGGIHLQHQAAA